MTEGAEARKDMRPVEERLRVTGLDHLVLTVRDAERSCRFYTQVLGLIEERFTGADGAERRALRLGDQKINLHVVGAEIVPHADMPQAGSADLCLRTRDPLSGWSAHLDRMGVPVELGPVARTGALGPITSLYLRDPDGNLIEIARYGP
ncbi:MAG: VOC family protein [Pseudomonadota bacterium]